MNAAGKFNGLDRYAVAEERQSDNEEEKIGVSEKRKDCAQ